MSRTTRLSSTPAMALRAGLMSAVTRLGPGIVLRTFDDVSGWEPPGRTYAAGTRGSRGRDRDKPLVNATGRTS
ncbi:hypothetical protein ACGFYA_26625 [Streptomyces sp. NPDC048305]|uniref:hypothetical protein n=1 Tax=Streptomyces sp. NPDC048305 TaxID=3365532 RepID=UPI00371A9F54